jgi:hypothetical protein
MFLSKKKFNLMRMLLCETSIDKIHLNSDPKNFIVCSIVEMKAFIMF